ncbi:GxxExxY protein [Sphingosinicella sp. LHD-64]|uniref:GxxExxY protein n=1 Tax=Sphingosinicella sp. LHD-64 TaxID=3072139 RepID=UPI00280E1494|nr:GxxExxY protein [Sphingosinicella sp. LHD-64]MDQ8755099.1 GxxExxY protein [Sphingosinicella sp. LHD-64]
MKPQSIIQAGRLDWFTQRRRREEVGADVERIASLAVDCGFRIHERLGPGLLESVYEAVLAQGLARHGLSVERQKPIPIRFDGLVIEEGFRADLLVEGTLLIELKCAERFAPVHGKQLLTYLRLMDLPLGLLMNFGAATFREGIRRVVNGYEAHAPL